MSDKIKPWLNKYGIGFIYFFAKHADIMLILSLEYTYILLMFNFLKRNNNTVPSTNSFTTNKAERDNLCEEIISSSSLKAGFYLLLVLSTFIVTVGLLKNNLILVIGGMLVAPLLSPILSISLSITIVNLKVFLRSIRIFIISALISLFVSYILGLIAKFSLDQIDLVASFQVLDMTVFLIPVAAGAAASFTWVKKDLNSSLPGVAITATLLPPLTVMGLSLAVGNFFVLESSFSIYMFNVLGIILGSLIVFVMMGFKKSAKKVIQQVKLEDKINH